MNRVELFYIDFYKKLSQIKFHNLMPVQPSQRIIITIMIASTKLWFSTFRTEKGQMILDLEWKSSFKTFFYPTLLQPKISLTKLVKFG